MHRGNLDVIGGATAHRLQLEIGRCQSRAHRLSRPAGDR
jgi:hypothetical protein